VEVEQVLGLLVLHAEVLALQNHDLVVELALVEPLKELEDVLALASEDVPLLEHVDHLEFVDPRFFDARFVDLDEDVGYLNLHQKSLAAATLGGGPS
jgi:hypothetical protein